MICLTDFTYRYYMFGNRDNGLNDLNLKAMDAEQLREHGHKMVDFIADYYKNIENFPVLSQVEPGYLQKLLPDSAPDTGHITTDQAPAQMQESNTPNRPRRVIQKPIRFRD